LEKYLFLTISIISTAIAQILTKYGAMQTGGISAGNFLGTMFKVIFNPFIFIGLVILGIGFFFWVQALTKLDLSLAYPAVASAYVIVTIVSSVIFSEVISPLRWLALGIIVLGVILLSQS